MELRSNIDLRYAVIGGSVSFVVMIAGSVLLGGLSGYKSFILVQTILPNVTNLCATLILALGTMLALMLAFLTFSIELDVNLEWAFFKRVKELSLTVTITLIATVIVYLLFNIPIVKADVVPANWYTYLYYSILFLGALLGGAFVTIVLFLYRTISGVIEIFNPDGSESYKLDEEE